MKNKSILDSRKIAGSQAKSARGEGGLPEREVLVGTSREGRPQPAEPAWSGNGEALHESSKPFVTETPLTAEAREAMLANLFHESLPHYGELFIADDRFYIPEHGPGQAQHMLTMLCHWLGIKPGYIGLEFEGVDTSATDGQRYTIYIETKALWDEFLLGATLAYALTRYLIEDCKQIHLPSSDQPALLATGTIVFGFGLVVVNGFLPEASGLDRIKHRLTKRAVTGIMGHNFGANYEHLLKGFLQLHAINPVAYEPCLGPWATKKLHVKTLLKPSQAVLEARHKQKLAKVKVIGVLWLVLVVIGVGSFTFLQRLNAPSAKLRAAQEQANLLAKLTADCKENLAYERQYADLTDIQTLRHLNSISLHCQSLDNRYQATADQLAQ